MGLIEGGTLELKPAAVAYDTMSRTLAGGLLKQCSRSEKIWTCDVIRADGKALWVVWVEDGVAQDWSIPADWRIGRVERLDTSSSEIKGDSVRIGAAPIFLIAR